MLARHAVSGRKRTEALAQRVARLCVGDRYRAAGAVLARGGDVDGEVRGGTRGERRREVSLVEGDHAARVREADGQPRAFVYAHGDLQVCSREQRRVLCTRRVRASRVCDVRVSRTFAEVPSALRLQAMS